MALTPLESIESNPSPRALCWKRFLLRKGWLKKSVLRPPDGYSLVLLVGTEGFATQALLTATPNKPLIDDGECVGGTSEANASPPYDVWHLWEDGASVRLGEKWQMKNSK